MKININLNFNKENVLVWEFDKAPQELKELSNHGGDEDYLILSYENAEEYSNYTLWRLINSLTICDYQKEIININGVDLYLYITSHG